MLVIFQEEGLCDLQACRGMHVGYTIESSIFHRVSPELVRVFITIIITIAAIAITEVTIIIVVATNSCQNMEPTYKFDLSAKFWNRL